MGSEYEAAGCTGVEEEALWYWFVGTVPLEYWALECLSEIADVEFWLLDLVCCWASFCRFDCW